VRTGLSIECVKQINRHEVRWPFPFNHLAAVNSRRALDNTLVEGLEVVPAYGQTSTARDVERTYPRRVTPRTRNQRDRTS